MALYRVGDLAYLFAYLSWGRLSFAFEVGVSRRRMSQDVSFAVGGDILVRSMVFFERPRRERMRARALSRVVSWLRGTEGMR